MTPGATTSGSMIFPDGTPSTTSGGGGAQVEAGVGRGGGGGETSQGGGGGDDDDGEEEAKGVETDGRLKLRVDALGDDDEAKVHLAGGGAEEDRRDARRDQRRRLRAAGHALVGEKDELRVGEAEVTARDDGWRFVFRGACSELRIGRLP